MCGAHQGSGAMGLYPQVPGARVGVACRVSLRAEKETEALISSSAQGNAQLMRSVVHMLVVLPPQ